MLERVRKRVFRKWETKQELSNLKDQKNQHKRKRPTAPTSGRGGVWAQHIVQRA